MNVYRCRVKKRVKEGESTSHEVSIPSHAVGDQVVARHPQSNNFHKATILTVGSKYMCKFNDGSEFFLSKNDVYPPELFTRTQSKLQTTNNCNSTSAISKHIRSMKAPSLNPVDKMKEKVRSLKADLKVEGLQFGGVVGTSILLAVLPLITIYMNMIADPAASLLKIPFIPKWYEVVDMTALWMLLGWITFQACLALLPIGRLVLGQVLRDGKRLKYRCNGIQALVITIVIIALTARFVRYSAIYDHICGLIFWSIIFSFLFAYYLYLRSCQLNPIELSSYGAKAIPIYDYFMGRELNPRITFKGADFDLKFFFELRPGLIGWCLINYSCIIKCREIYGSLNSSLCLIALFQFIYVLDALWHEECVLTTMDILTDGFGFMLLFGDICWVPFLYSLQCQYLLKMPKPLPGASILFNVAVFFMAIGYIIFRSSNNQKNDFRINPQAEQFKTMETIDTNKTKKLLVSGWWGIVRHPNYFGDILMAISWSLPCGFLNVAPWFYPIYFTILLIHRDRRDNIHCQEKYEQFWTQYCARVPYRIFPRIY
ncbi:hypothetical protein SNEBB_010062 [Seison nebaliae]|nr:hypothetical protein SNEBB_010062 [Seison nebaliae]